MALQCRRYDMGMQRVTFRPGTISRQQDEIDASRGIFAPEFRKRPFQADQHPAPYAVDLEDERTGARLVTLQIAYRATTFVVTPMDSAIGADDDHRVVVPVGVDHVMGGAENSPDSIAPAGAGNGVLGI